MAPLSHGHRQRRGRVIPSFPGFLPSFLPPAWVWGLGATGRSRKNSEGESGELGLVHRRRNDGRRLKSRGR